jgi:preprotein translocase subunit SecA
VPLVIAGGTDDERDVVQQADRTVRGLLEGRHFSVEGHERNILLTPAGVTQVERAMGCDNLFDDRALTAHTAVQDALHAHVLLRHDVDYVVSDGTVLPVDEFKGRIVPDRRWPAGLQTALEAKEGVRRRRQGRVFGSITVENLVGLYPRVAGMTGTAATQTDEFLDVYDIDVQVIQPHRPVIREDHPDEVFPTRAEKESAIRRAIREVHATGRPVLVGTASVEESEQLSRALRDIPHHVLNARNEEAEAAIIARAGERGAVTISTNMAGRGVDIRLGDGVAELGGLHVIGTNRHESRRIDHQLRGRAGRQGDPGSSRFFISREDPLFTRYSGGDKEMSPDQCQRVIEGENLEIRLFLRRYESVIEAQRLSLADRRQAIVGAGSAEERDRLIQLAVIDDLWSDYLAAVAEMRSGSAWISLGYGDPLGHYLRQIHAMFGEMQQMIETETEHRLSDTESNDEPPSRGATWTYLTHDEPFGRMTTRIMKQLVKRHRAKKARRREAKRR